MSLDEALSVREEKYTVRKSNGELLPPGTYFVIRGSDLFAAAGLWAYVNCLQTVLEMASSRPVLSARERIYLRLLTDRAVRLASSWQQAGHGRLPD